jgi:DNA polymerase I-like protein with 3'-5' exonuclease and polymerase domains
MLGHYMARYDKGEYAKVILEGDIHTVNQQAAGLPTRNDAKTFIYAFLYGAGPVKLGSIVEPLTTEEEQRKIGLALMSSFLKKTPALKKLREEVKHIVDERGSLKAIDGRVLRIRSSHSALNTLFQSAGAIVVKRATILLHQKMREAGYVYGYPNGDWVQMAHVHDEFQLGLNPKVDAQAVGQIAVESIREAGVYFNFRLPLDGEFKVGRNWAETH